MTQTSLELNYDSIVTRSFPGWISCMKKNMPRIAGHAKQGRGLSRVLFNQPLLHR